MGETPGMAAPLGSGLAATPCLIHISARLLSASLTSGGGPSLEPAIPEECGGESSGAHGEIRTPSLLVRSQSLYPDELRARVLPYYPRNPPGRHFATLTAAGMGNASLEVEVKIAIADPLAARTRIEQAGF